MLRFDSRIRSPLPLVLLLTVSLGTVAAAQTRLAVGDTAVVSAPRGNLMLGRETVASIPRGTKLEVREVQGDWIGVWFQDQGGWLRMSEVTRETAAGTEVRAVPSEPTSEDVAEPGKLRTPQILFDEGVAFLEKNDVAAARQKFLAALSEDPKHAKSQLNLGVCALMERDYTTALRELNEAIELDPKQPYAYWNRAQCYRVLEDIPRAVADLTKAIELDPDFAAAYAERADAYQALGRVAEAQADRRKALELDAETPAVEE